MLIKPCTFRCFLSGLYRDSSASKQGAIEKDERRGCNHSNLKKQSTDTARPQWYSGLAAPGTGYLKHFYDDQFSEFGLTYRK